MTSEISGLYKFGPFCMDTKSRALTRDGEPVTLAPKTFDLLALLAESEGRLLTKNELLHALWDESFVEEGNLTYQVSVLRKALAPEGNSWIETVPKHGYRFLAPVERTVPARARTPEQEGTPPGKRFGAPGLRWIVTGAVVCGLAALGVWTVRGRQPAAVPVEPVRLTAYPGAEISADFSPDGSQIVFAWNGADENNFDLWVKLAGQGEPIHLTDHPADDLSPAWSPDGRSIAFVRVFELEKCGIFIKPALGGAERLVRPITSGFWRSEYPNRVLAWTPDGTGLIAAGIVEGQPQGLWIVNPATGDFRRLTSPTAGAFDLGPAVRPDGTAVAFTRFRVSGQNEIFLLPLKQNAAAGDARQITFDSRPNGSPAWTPDGSALFYSWGYHVGFRTMRRMSIGSDWRRSRPATQSFGEQATTVAVSRQGRMVYAKEMRDANIWRIRLDSPAQPVRVVASTLDDHTPAYSPDGGRIAFASTRSGAEEIWMSNADGSQPVQLTQMNGPKTANPQFSPHGASLLFNSQKDGISDLYRVELASGRVERLTTGPGNKLQARWSRDGRSIYYSSDAAGVFQVWKMPAGGGPGRRVCDIPRTWLAVESDDGKTLFVAEHHVLWAVPNDGGRPVKVLDDLSYSLNFVVVPRGIYYISASPARRQAVLKFYDFAQRSRKTVVELGKPWWFGLALSPDRRSLLCSLLDVNGSDLLMVDNVR